MSQLLNKAKLEMQQRLQDAERGLKLADVLDRIISLLSEAAEIAREDSSERLSRAIQLVEEATELEFGDEQQDPEVTEVDPIQPQTQTPPAVPVGLNPSVQALLHTLVTQEPLPTSLQELCAARWGTDLATEIFRGMGSNSFPIAEDIADPATSRLGRYLANGLRSIEMTVKESHPLGSVPTKPLADLALRFQEVGIDEVITTVKMWGIPYPPK